MTEKWRVVARFPDGSRIYRFDTYEEAVAFVGLLERDHPKIGRDHPKIDWDIIVDLPKPTEEEGQNGQ